MTSSSRARSRAIDFHAHIIVPEVYALAAQHNIFSELPTDPGVTDDMRGSIKARATAVLTRMSDLTDRIVNMDAMGVDVQVLSASLVHQGLEWADAQTSLRLARTTNDWIAKAVAAHPARLVGLGTLPLHVPALAVVELERCVRELRLKGAAISTTAGAMELGDPQLRPFWGKAEELSAVIYIHPGGNRDRRFKRFHLWNSVGQAFEEAMAISSLMYDGVLETFPRLKICVSHGGGYMPYYMGRIDRNYAEKANTRVNMSKPPIDYLRMLYFDSCVYERAVLQHLVDKVGVERVLLGSDYPVGEVRPVEFVTDTDTLSPTRRRCSAWQIRSRPDAGQTCNAARFPALLRSIWAKGSAAWTKDDGRTAAQSDFYARARTALGRGPQSHGGAQDRRAGDAEQQRLARRLCPMVHRHAAEQRLSAQRRLPRLGPDDRGRHGRARRASQDQRQRRGQPWRRGNDLHAGLYQRRLYRRIPGRARRRRTQAARLPHHRMDRQRRHAAQIRRAHRTRARRQGQVRGCDRIRRSPQGDQERRGEGTHPQGRRDAGRGFHARAQQD